MCIGCRSFAVGRVDVCVSGSFGVFWRFLAILGEFKWFLAFLAVLDAKMKTQIDKMEPGVIKNGTRIDENEVLGALGGLGGGGGHKSPPGLRKGSSTTI